MAVAHSAASESHTGTTGSSNQAAFSWTHTQTGTPQGVVVFVSTYASVADLITSVTYGGVALTRLTGGLAQDSAGESGRLDTFFLGSGLGTGNQTITVNRTNNATVMYAAAATVTAGANTAVPTSTIVLLEGDGTLAVQSVDDTSPGQNSLRYAGTYSGLNAPPTAGTGSTLLNSIDIGNYGSALVRETTAGQGARNVGFTGTTDDRAAVHLAIRELVPRTETPIVGTFTLTGNAADLAKASPKVMDGGTGAFTLTGNAADLRHNTAIDGGAGAFALAANDATLGHNVNIDGGTGSFSLTGNTVTLTIAGGLNNYNLAVDTGSYALTAGAPTLTRSYAVSAATGTFAVVGNPATLADTDQLQTTTGTFSLSGGTPALLRTYYLSGGTGQFTETGQPATFSRTYNTSAVKGTFVLTGNAAALTTVGSYEIDATTGAFVVSGSAATLTVATVLPTNTATFLLNGNTSSLKHNYRIFPSPGSFQVSGKTASFAIYSPAKELSVSTASFTLNGNTATLSKGFKFYTNAGSYSLTGNEATFSKDYSFAAAQGQFTLTGPPPVFTKINFYTVEVAPGAFLFTGTPSTLTYTARRRVLLVF